MAKLYFYYSAMNAGKSTMLLQADYNYQERGLSTLLFTPDLDNRHKKGYIHSRIGIKAKAIAFAKGFNFFDHVATHMASEKKPLHAVLIDEAQFLTQKQVYQLTQIVDGLHVSVLAYGLRNDFRGELFTGSTYLLAWSEEINEVKTMCHCGRKAIMNMRINKHGEKVEEGPQVQIGGNTTYIACCRRHYKKGQAPLIRSVRLEKNT